MPVTHSLAPRRGLAVRLVAMKAYERTDPLAGIRR
jgi:hypothetical protein